MSTDEFVVNAYIERSFLRVYVPPLSMKDRRAQCQQELVLAEPHGEALNYCLLARYDGLLLRCMVSPLDDALFRKQIGCLASRAFCSVLLFPHWHNSHTSCDGIYEF